MDNNLDTNTSCWDEQGKDLIQFNPFDNDNFDFKNDFSPDEQKETTIFINIKNIPKNFTDYKKNEETITEKFFNDFDNMNIGKNVIINKKNTCYKSNLNKKLKRNTISKTGKRKRKNFKKSPTIGSTMETSIQNNTMIIDENE